MSDQQYDNRNSGVVFLPHPDQQLIGQGKLNIDGNDHRVVMVREKVSRDGDPMNVLYVRLAPMFDNDRKSENENAPDKSGPGDILPNKRVAAWRKTKDNRPYYSLAISEKRSNGEGGGGEKVTAQHMDDFVGDDEIPF